MGGRGGVVHSMCINTHVLLHECVCVYVWGGSSFDVYKYSCSSP